jgi:hypothetical protein
MAELIRIPLTTLAVIGRSALKKVCIPSAATRAPLRKSAFPTGTAVAMVPGTRHTRPGAAARRHYRPHTAWACSIASQLINGASSLAAVPVDKSPTDTMRSLCHRWRVGWLTRNTSRTRLRAVAIENPRSHDIRRGLMNNDRSVRSGAIVILAGLCLLGLSVALGAQTQSAPKYKFDSDWPKPLPNKWKM